MCDIPVIDVSHRLLKPAQHFGRRRPLDVFPIILHAADVLEAAVDLADVGLHLVAAVGPKNDESRSHPPVTHPGNCAAPYLKQKEEKRKRTKTNRKRETERFITLAVSH